MIVRSRKSITLLAGHHQYLNTITIIAVAPPHLIAAIPDDRIINLALQAYRLGQFPSLNSAAKAYNLPPSTLKARNKRNINRRDAHAERQLLTPTQEQDLAEWILDQEAVGLAPNHAQLRDITSLISRLNGGPKRVGKH